MEVVAASQLIGLLPNGERLAITIEIGKPTLSETNPDTWACPIRIEPLHSSLPDIIGGDALHALCLAVNFVLNLLDAFIHQGGRLLLDDDSEFPLNAYWSKAWMSSH